MFADAPTRRIVHSRLQAAPMVSKSRLLYCARQVAAMNPLPCLCRLKEPKMPLKILLFKQIPHTFQIAVESRIALLCPCEQRRIVRNRNQHWNDIADLLRQPRKRLACHFDVWQATSVIQRLVEVPQALIAWKLCLRIFCEKAHQACVPNPNVEVKIAFLHHWILRHSRNVLYIPMRQFPCKIVEFNELWMSVIHRNRN